MRRNFAEVLRSGGIDLKDEYTKLHALYYEPSIPYNKRLLSLYEIIDDHFTSFRFRGTCILLKEFDGKYGFIFAEQPQNFDIDYLVRFAEYFCNMLLELQKVIQINNPFCDIPINFEFVFEQIGRVIESIGYMQSTDDGFIIFLPKDAVAVAASESDVIPADVSFRVIEYNHHSMNGDLERKKAILLRFADLLEPQRKALENIDRPFTSELFYAFNNFNIRHNNVDPAGTKYKKPIGDMSDEDLEKWYDEVYQMCLLAFLRLEQAERKTRFGRLKMAIEAEK